MPAAPDHLRDAFADLARDEAIAEADLPGLVHAASLIPRLILAPRPGADQPLVLGLCGPQGSGKSTLSRGLAAALSRSGMATAVISLDDLYLSRAARARLAREVHPLFVTRGVPGTHDVARGAALLDRLAWAGPRDVTALPRFDKARDEPVPAAEEAVFTGRPAVILFEGWCVGARPQSRRALLKPVNDLERDQDPEGVWRGHVNAQLAGPYRELFSRVERLVMLRAPGFAQVHAWRRQQEAKLARKLAAEGRLPKDAAIMDEVSLRTFIMHFERISRHLHRQMPRYADLVLQLDGRRRVVGFT